MADTPNASRTTRIAPNPDYEPDFYSMVALPPPPSIGHGCCPPPIPLFSPQDETKADVGNEPSIDNEFTGTLSSPASFTETPFSPLICEYLPSKIFIPNISVAGTPLAHPRSSITSVAKSDMLDLSFLNKNEDNPHSVHSAPQMFGKQEGFGPDNGTHHFFSPQQAEMTCSLARASDAEEGHGNTSSFGFEHCSSYEWEPYNVGNAPTLSFEERSKIVTVVMNIE